MISASLKLLSCIDYYENCNRKNIVKHISTTTSGPTFDPIVNDIISSGRIQLIKNADLKQKLSLWTSEIIQVTEEEQTWIHYSLNEYIPFLLEQGVLRNIYDEFWITNPSLIHLDGESVTDFKIGSSRKEVDFVSMLNNKKFEGFVAQCATYSKFANSQSLSLRKRIVKILEIIKGELK
jgi:hypothetical protein